MENRVYDCLPERDDGVAVPPITACSLEAAAEIVKILLRPDITKIFAVRVAARVPLPGEQ